MKGCSVSVEDASLALSSPERQLLEEVMHALRRIRFGSVVLTVHEGRVVEIHKTEKIRKSG